MRIGESLKPLPKPPRDRQHRKAYRAEIQCQQGSAQLVYRCLEAG